MTSVKLNDQDKQTSKLLAENGITFEVFVTRELVQDAENNWLHDAYKVVFTKANKSHSFDYKQGIGHRVNKLPIKSENNKPLKLAQKLSNDKSLYNKNQPTWGQKQWLVLPTAASVIWSLMLDSSACNESFGDWCSNYGYDEDSRKALELYLECQAVGQKLGFLSGIRSQIEEILQDY